MHMVGMLCSLHKPNYEHNMHQAGLVAVMMQHISYALACILSRLRFELEIMQLAQGCHHADCDAVDLQNGYNENMETF